MDILKIIESKAKQNLKSYKFDIEYIPGITEEDDVYVASNKELKIECFGKSEESAISSAKKEAIIILMAPTLN
jgi:hypothetical protein